MERALLSAVVVSAFRAPLHDSVAVKNDAVPYPLRAGAIAKKTERATASPGFRSLKAWDCQSDWHNNHLQVTGCYSASGCINRRAIFSVRDGALYCATTAPPS